MASAGAAVVLDIGRAYTRLGFAGEPSPRAVVDTRVARTLPAGAGVQQWRPVLQQFLARVWPTYLLVDAADRLVVVVEDPFAPEAMYNAVEDVLRSAFNVKACVRCALPLLVLRSLDVPTGLVVDLGSHCVSVAPVVHGALLPQGCDSSPLGSTQLLSEFRDALKLEESVPDATLEDVMLRSAVVLPSARDATPVTDMTFSGLADGIPSPLVVPGSVRKAVFDSLWTSRTKEAEPGTQGDDVGDDDSSDAEDIQRVPGLVLQCVRACPIDVRRPLLRNIILVGGLMHTPGLRARLACELDAVISVPEAARLVRLTGPPHTLAWRGASILAAVPDALTAASS